MRMNLRKDLRWGLGWALAMTALFSAYILLMRLLRGEDTFAAAAGVSASVVIATYLGSGIFVGLLLGFLRRRTSTAVGRAIIGVFSGWAVFTCIALASEGWFNTWSRQEWEGILVLGAVFGLVIPLGIIWINRKMPLD